MSPEIHNGIALPIALSLASVVALVICDYRGLLRGRYLFKPLAAVAFVWLALSLGALHSLYGLWLLAALLLCMVGDLCLMGDGEAAFLAGLFAFLCGHLLYAIAFLQLPPAILGPVLSLLPAGILMAIVWRWLSPHVPDKMRIPVMLYILVIGAMLLCAGLTYQHPAAGLIIAGAWGFALSDIAVARRQFIDPSRVNGLWGTPLYFASQMLLAGSAALA